MQKSQIDAVTLVVATLAAALALTQIAGPLAWLSSIGGLILVFILFSFDQEGYRYPFQSLAFSSVCGFSTAVAAGAIFQLLANNGEVHLGNGQWASEYMPLTWVFATALYWVIDLMRMNARKLVPIQVPRALGETRIFAEAPAPVSYAQPVAAPPLAYQAPAYQTPVHQPPVYQAPPQPAAPRQAPQPIYRPVEPVAPPPSPAVASAPPPPEPVQAAPEFPTATSFFAIPPNTTARPAQPTAPIAPVPAPAVSHSGKETTIYVSLLGEGLNVLRSVRAEPLGRDFYRIIDEMPETENWQFQPGQVVRCKKKNLSSGKAMVATEEAPRAT